MARSAEEGKKNPCCTRSCLSPDSKSSCRNNLQAQASLGFDIFSLPPPFVSSVLEGCSKQTGNVTQKCGSTFVSCFRKMSVSQSCAVELTHSISEESFEQFWPFVLKTTLGSSPQRHRANKLLGGVLCILNIDLQQSRYATDVFLSWHCRHDSLLLTRTISPRLGYTSRIYLDNHMLVHRVSIIFTHSLQISPNFSLEHKMSLKVSLNKGEICSYSTQISVCSWT